MGQKGENKYAHITKEFLEHRYNIDNLTQREIAIEVGLSDKVISYLVKKYGIKPLHNNYRHHACREDYFQTWSGSMAYILAFITCDGYVHPGGQGLYKSLWIDLQEKDYTILEFIRSEICPEAPIRLRVRYDKRTDQTYRQVNLRLLSRRLLNDLENFGIVSHKTGFEFLPDIPVQFRPDYIRGLIDGDGSIILGKTIINGICYLAPKLHFTSASLSFLEQIRAQFLDGIGNIFAQPKSHCFFLEIARRKDIIDILTTVYNGGFCLRRKFEKFLAIKEYDGLMQGNSISRGTILGLNRKRGMIE